jgi:hypothetical protein
LVVGRLGFLVWVALALGAVACGGESISEDDDDTGLGGSSGTGGTGGSGGVPRTKYLDELTTAEKLWLCEWAVAEQGGPGEQTCADGTTVTVTTVEECATGDFSPFHCLVGLAVDCIESLNGNACGITTTPACEAYIDCVIDS